MSTHDKDGSSMKDGGNSHFDIHINSSVPGVDSEKLLLKVGVPVDEKFKLNEDTSLLSSPGLKD
jgi:hypothetical protein